MPRGAPPLSPGDVVVSDYRVPPFYKDETLLVDEIKNVGTRGNPGACTCGVSAGADLAALALPQPAARAETVLGVRARRKGLRSSRRQLFALSCGRS